MSVLVTGHAGMVGSAIKRRLEASGTPVTTLSRDDVDLRNQAKVFETLAEIKPHSVVVAAARVGGIVANSRYPADFIYDNLMIESNLVHGAYLAGCKKLLFLGSSCIYPKFAEQPMTENSLLSGPLEPTNEAYAIAKIVGLKICEAYNVQYGTDYRSLMPTNLYGPGDNFNPEGSHVIPGLMRRIHEAKENNVPSVTVWGTGKAMREFLHVDDLAIACEHVMKLDKRDIDRAVEPNFPHINVGTGVDVTIKELAQLLVGVIGYEGELIFDDTKPDGTPRKLLDVSRIKSLGWEPTIDLNTGLHDTYRWFCENQSDLRQ